MNNGHFLKKQIARTLWERPHFLHPKAFYPRLPQALRMYMMRKKADLSDIRIYAYSVPSDDSLLSLRVASTEAISKSGIPPFAWNDSLNKLFAKTV